MSRQFNRYLSQPLLTRHSEAAIQSFNDLMSNGSLTMSDYFQLNYLKAEDQFYT